MFESLSKAQFSIMIALFAAIVIFGVVGIIFSVKKKSAYKPFSAVMLAVCGALAVALIVVSMVETYSAGKPVFSTEFGLYICTAAVIAVIAVLALVFCRTTECNHTKSIVYAAICVGTSFALSYIRLFELPQGGSVTLASLLPLMVYSYMFGVRKGVIAGMVYGLLQFVQAPWFYHPVQFLLDYPIAFAAIGLTGFFHDKKILENKKPIQFFLGALLAVTVRYSAHVISGIFVFGSGDPANYSATAWSFLYNAFVYVDLAFDIAAGCAVFASKSFNKLLAKASD